VNARRDLTGLIAQGQAPPPERTVASPPPRRRADHTDPGSSAERSRTTADHDGLAGAPGRRRKQPTHEEHAAGHSSTSVRPAQRKSGTVRISVNIPLACRQWLADQARQQQRFVSEIVMDALARHGDDAQPPAGRAKRRAVPDGAICNIVLPTDDRERIDQAVATKQTTRSALLTEVLDLARKA